MEHNPIEKCVVCGKDTPYRFNDHIDTRYGYVEGSGQGCYQPNVCSMNKGTLCIPELMVYDTPNDQELGKKVRSIYWETKQVQDRFKDIPFNIPKTKNA
jgi:hypothetical protein